ncbi:MAG TPA: response regulator, partial [Bacteroidales bacterium]|nr:response regulator [Bacteroidales bacterium]
KVKQILINILGNAIKFTHKGTVEVAVCIKETTEKMMSAEIEISDTGMGIAKDKIQHIFEEFSQADSNITRKFGGTGLGLSISKKMTELMNGSISVKSLLNEGSTFTIAIPFEICQNVDCLEKSTTLSQVNLEGVKILVVEDDETMRLLLNHICNTYRIDVQFALNGKDALEKLKNEAFNLVLSDIQMPEMSGIELVRRIKKTIDNQLPVLAFTAHSSVPDEAIKAGFDAFLSKPFTEREIVSKIAETLGIQAESLTFGSKTTDAPEDTIEKGYSFSRLKEFTGTDEAAFLDIMANFISNTEADFQHMKKDLDTNHFDDSVNKIHKLLPMFKQLQVNTLIDEMLMIERSKELELKNDDLKLFIENFLEQAQKIIKKMKEELSVPSSGH